MTAATPTTIPARDGYSLGGMVYPASDRSQKAGRVVVVNSATAVPQGFYRRFASYLAQSGYTVVTYDYRGIGSSRRGPLRGFEATMSDWAMHDLAGAIDWAVDSYPGDAIYLIGHSFGGQVAGMIDTPDVIAGMATMSAQSGYWRYQGAEQKWLVWFHVHATLPATSAVVGYSPWARLGMGEDLPKGVANQWARWCRSPGYLWDDPSLPTERYADFTAPVLALSFDDDKWGTQASVDAWMTHYPNVERRHITASDVGVDNIGHMGYFRESSTALWSDVTAWFDSL